MGSSIEGINEMDKRRKRGREGKGEKNNEKLRIAVKRDPLTMGGGVNGGPSITCPRRGRQGHTLRLLRYHVSSQRVASHPVLVPRPERQKTLLVSPVK